MADLVIDSSVVAVKWFVVEPYSADARKVLDGYRNGSVSLLAPDLVNAEFGNIVWKKHALQGLAATDAQAVIDGFRALQFTFVTTWSLLDDAYQIAVKHRRTVYDSLYLALSLRANCQFVTADERFVNAIGSSFPNIVSVAKWTQS